MVLRTNMKWLAKCILNFCNVMLFHIKHNIQCRAGFYLNLLSVNHSAFVFTLQVRQNRVCKCGASPLQRLPWLQARGANMRIHPGSAICSELAWSWVRERVGEQLSSTPVLPPRKRIRRSDSCSGTGGVAILSAS